MSAARQFVPIEQEDLPRLALGHFVEPFEEPGGRLATDAAVLDRSSRAQTTGRGRSGYHRRRRFPPRYSAACGYQARQSIWKGCSRLLDIAEVKLLEQVAHAALPHDSHGDRQPQPRRSAPARRSARCRGGAAAIGRLMHATVPRTAPRRAGVRRHRAAQAVAGGSTICCDQFWMKMFRLPCRAIRNGSSRGRPSASRIARCLQGGAMRSRKPPPPAPGACLLGRRCAARLRTTRRSAES